ncbi:hypothetical protein [Nesterenkonia natronophila]|nr:hypothetical protein [Nesterenkonia natronophila]
MDSVTVDAELLGHAGMPLKQRDVENTFFESTAKKSGPYQGRVRA